MKKRKIESSGGDDYLASLSMHHPRAVAPKSTKAITPRDRTPRVAQAVLEGAVQLNPGGFGFAARTLPDGRLESYFIRPPATRGLLTGDKIQFVAAPQSAQDIAKNSRTLGKVLGVVRKPTVLLSEVQPNGKLFPDEPCSVDLEATNAASGSAPGDVVVVRIPAYTGPATHEAITGEITANLGPRNRAGFYQAYAQAKFGFDAEMPEDLMAQDLDTITLIERLEGMAELGTISLTSKLPYVTIDGSSTLDFDDAVHAEKLDDGWRIHVAISDVARFVRPGSELDAWAAGRGTSVYLPGCKLPMLPVELSQGACSLQQGVPRYAVVQTLELDEAGIVRAVAFTRELIVVHGQLAYEQVAGVMETGASLTEGIGGIPLLEVDSVAKNVSALCELYPLLAARRLSRGLLDIEEPDPMPEEVDGQWRMRWAVRTAAHKLVEELMLMANHQAARYLIQRYGAGLFRHQAVPDGQAWAELRAYASSMGHVLPEVPSIQAMTSFAAIQKHPDQHAAVVMKLRSAMRPAAYAVKRGSEQGGHFSLDYDWYTHFTSPIRRYADLLVHRLLTAPAGFVLDDQAFYALAMKVEHCSDRAQAAKMSERFVLDKVKLESVMAAVSDEDEQAFQARVIRQSQRGVKVLLSGWQTVAWLSSSYLIDAGYQWESDAWRREDAPALEEGRSLSVIVVGLVSTRPAYPELQVRTSQEIQQKAAEIA